MLSIPSHPIIPTKLSPHSRLRRIGFRLQVLFCIALLLATGMESITRGWAAGYHIEMLADVSSPEFLRTFVSIMNWPLPKMLLPSSPSK